MERKDYFSQQSAAYATFRPTYPDALYDYIYKHLSGNACAWDCATGNGQVASHLADHFDAVYATDISPQQLAHAVVAKNIFYNVSAAEQTPFKDQQFDLITVAQALHWFDTPAFYREVVRTGKPGGILAVWGYAILQIDPAIDNLFMNFYMNTVGPYWDAARRLVENHYREIPFPFTELHCPTFNIRVDWTRDQFTGYLTSWSATQKYISVNGSNPVTEFSEMLKSVWQAGVVKPVTFPLFMKLGRI